MKGAVAFALLVGSVACGGSASTPPAGHTLVLRGATLLDGTGGAPLVNATVIIADGRVAAVGPTSVVPVPPGATVEEVGGRHLIPGLIDVHVHALVPRCLPDTGFDWAMSRAMMVTLLRFGITSARSPATPTALGIAMRDSLAAGAFPGPRLLVAGDLIDGRRTTVAEVRAEVRRQAAAGVDFIKLYSALPPEAARAGITEARATGLRTVGHLERTTWMSALATGIDQLTHVAPWTDDLLPPDRRPTVAGVRRRAGTMRARLDWLEAFDPDAAVVDTLLAALVHRGVPLDPTLVAFDTKFSYDSMHRRAVAARYREHPRRDVVPGLRDLWLACGTPTDGWSADAFRRMAVVWPRLLRLVRRYHEAGVLLTAGSDTPNPWVIPGEGLHRELELLVEAGIPPSAVLRIATRNGAAALGILGETGTIEVGKRADLVLLEADPLVDIANTRRIAWVMQGGVRVR